MKIVLALGEKIEVELADTDGRFTIEYGHEVLTVHSDLPDSSGREGLLYSEEFARAHRELQIAYGPEKDSQAGIKTCPLVDWPKFAKILSRWASHTFDGGWEKAALLTTVDLNMDSVDCETFAADLEDAFDLKSPLEIDKLVHIQDWAYAVAATLIAEGS